MPQKNEDRDRFEILQKSKEFNPVIEFDMNSPYSSQRTSQPKMSSSRSNSDLVAGQNSLSLIASMEISQRGAIGSKVKPFTPAQIDINNNEIGQQSTT